MLMHDPTANPTTKRFRRTLAEAFADEAFAPIERVTLGFRQPIAIPPATPPQSDSLVRRLLARVLCPTVDHPRKKP